MRILTRCLIFIALFAGLQLAAQDPMNFVYRPHWPGYYASTHHAIAFSGEYSAGCDGLSNAFLNALYSGMYINSTMKANEESRLLPSNRFGLYASYGMAYSWRNNPDSMKWEFTIAVRDRQSSHGIFTSDAFKLAFEGNRPFRGETADLSGSNLTYMHWQQVQFEGKYYTPDHQSEAAFGFSVLSGQQLQEVNIREGKMFTASNGTAIDLLADASYYSSDTAKNKMFSSNGTGTCFNFRFSTLLGDSAARFHHQLLFSVQDLGYIRWNKQSLIYNVDTSLHYTGVNASDVILNHSNFSGLPNSDSLIGTPDDGQVITFLPLGIRARYTLLTPYSWWAGVDLRIWSYADALPQITLFGGWHDAKNRLIATEGVSWGGYCGLQVPLQIGYNACDHFSVSVGTTNIAGFLVPGKTSGQGAFANMSFAF
jgi:uncharacterized protein YjbI with pentapeptide repeats